MDKELLAALIRLIVLLPLICILAYLTVRFGLGRTKHLAAYRAGKRMRVLEQLSMGPKSGLSLVQVGDRFMLFAHQENCIILVREMEQLPSEITAATREIPVLSRVFKDIGKRENKPTGGN